MRVLFECVYSCHSVKCIQYYTIIPIELHSVYYSIWIDYIGFILLLSANDFIYVTNPKFLR